MKDYSVDEDGQRVLTQWLHELGDILYFREDDELTTGHSQATMGFHIHQ